MPRNLLLAALPAADYSRLAPHLRPANLDVTVMIHPPDQTLREIYFLEGALNSIVVPDSHGQSVEAALAGVEGITGVPDVVANERTVYAGIVEASGDALAIDVARFQEEWERGEAFQRLVLHYSQYLHAQMGQTTICNTTHSTVERLSRWLLMASDAVQSERIGLTPEYVETMLAEGPTASMHALNALASNGIIEYDNGLVTITDRESLAGAACDCYATMLARRQELLEGYAEA